MLQCRKEFKYKMLDYTKLADTAMLDYVNETKSVLQNLLDNRKEYFKPFSELFLKEDIKQIICTGSGTSFHCAQSVREFMGRVLGIQILADYPRIIDLYFKKFYTKTMIIGVSQSGESKSTIQTLNIARSEGCVNVGISEKLSGTSLSECCDLIIPLNCGEELAGPKTKGYEASCMCLALAALETAYNSNKITENEYINYVNRFQAAINNIPKIIEESIKWYKRNEAELLDAKRFIVVGYGNNYGNILEGRLKLEESIRIGVEGYELEEFMHGIYHSIDENVQLIYLAQSGEYKDRIFRLKNFLLDYSQHEYVIGNLYGTEASEKRNLSTNFTDDQ